MLTIPLYSTIPFHKQVIYPIFHATVYCGTAMIRAINYLGTPIVNAARHLIISINNQVFVPLLQVLKTVINFITWQNLSNLLLLIVGIIFHPVIGLHLALVTPALTAHFFRQACLASLFVLPVSYWEIKKHWETTNDRSKRSWHIAKVSCCAVYAILSFATLSNHSQISKLLKP